MSEFTMDRLRENLEALKMKNTLEILDNYLERAVNVVFLGPPGVGKTHLASALGPVAAQHRFSTKHMKNGKKKILLSRLSVLPSSAWDTSLT